VKRSYSGLEAIKVSFNGSSVVTTSSQCWQYVANRVGQELQCTTDDPGKVDEWVDYNDPLFPTIGLPGC